MEASSDLEDVPRTPEAVEAVLDEAWNQRAHRTGWARGHAERALAGALEIGYAAGEARACRSLALLAFEDPDFDLALQRAARALEIYRELGDVSGEAAAQDTLATLLEVIGDLSGAMEHALEALELARRSGDRAREGWALSSVGGLLSARGDAEAARRELGAGLAVFEGLGDASGIARLSNRLGRLELDLGHYSEARAHYRRQLEQLDGPKDLMPRAGAIASLARLDAVEGHLPEARAGMEQALELLGPELSETVGSEIRVGLAVLRARLGEVDVARAELSRIVDATVGFGVLPVALQATRNLADLEEEAGNLEAALAWMRRHLDLQAAQSQRERTTLTRRLEARRALEAAEKDAEIHRLRYVELSAMQDELVEAGKLAMLGRLAAGFAHEVNNPLGVLMSALDLGTRVGEQLGRAELEAPAQRRAGRALLTSVGACRQALERLQRFARSLAVVAHLDRGEETDLDLAEILRDQVALVQPSLPPGVRVELVGPSRVVVRGQGAAINQMVMAVLTVVVDDLEEGGVALVEIHPREAEVEVVVGHRGRSRDQAELAALFEVGFERGARVRAHLGLGAAVETARRHGGSLSAEGEGGTRLRLTLPTRGASGD